MIRRLTLLLFAAIAMLPVCAQFRYAPTVGADYSTLNFKQDLIEINATPGLRAGVNGELMFPGIGFGIDVGAFYSMRGAKVNLGQKEIWASEGYGNERVFLHYLEIPFNLKFKWTRMQGLEDYIAPYVLGGPVFDFLIGHSNQKAIDFAGGTLGVRAGGGFELFRRWQVQIAYTWGMTYALKTVKLDQFSARNRYFSLSVARYF
ncbi:MAG: PorT family protein [Muribaculaceae bacterium]|nr:PorT family protein [Muribaculaceae bacterium]